MKPTFDILLSYLKGIATPQENLEVEQWKKTDPANAASELGEASRILKALSQASFLNQLDGVADTLGKEGFFKPAPWYKRRSGKMALILGLVLVILLSIFVYFYYFKNGSFQGNVLINNKIVDISTIQLLNKDSILKTDNQQTVPVATLYKNALEAKQKGDLPTAFALIDQAIKRDSNNAEYWLEGARILAQAAEKPGDADAWNTCINGAELPLLDVLVLWGTAPGNRTFVHFIDWNTKKLRRGFYGQYAYSERISDKILLNTPANTLVAYDIQNGTITPFEANATPGKDNRYVLIKEKGPLASLVFPEAPKGARAIIEALSLSLNKIPRRIEPLNAENAFLLDFGPDSLLLVSRKEKVLLKYPFAPASGYQLSEDRSGIAVSKQVGDNLLVEAWSADGKASNHWTIPDKSAEIFWVGAYADKALAYSASSGRFFLLNEDGTLSQQIVRKGLQYLTAGADGRLCAASLNGKTIFYARSEVIFVEDNNLVTGQVSNIGFGNRILLMMGCNVEVYKYSDKSKSLQYTATAQVREVLQGLAIEFLHQALLKDKNLQKNIAKEFEQLKQHANFMLLK